MIRRQLHKPAGPIGAANAGRGSFGQLLAQGKEFSRRPPSLHRHHGREKQNGP